MSCGLLFLHNMAHHDDRATKRVKQACLNCRRKKTRCSGEQPVCSFCARLSQPCIWDTGTDSSTSVPANNTLGHSNPSDSALAARVALLESKLSFLGSEAAQDTSASPPTSPLGRELSSSQPYDSSSLPPKSSLATLIDTYFTYCHCQPYSYFHEPTFRQRFEHDALPTSVLLAVAATAYRFTSDSGTQDLSSSQAIKYYADASWTQIFQQSFSYDDEPDVTMVQTISMLAVIDFTAGHPRHGWVKVGLSVRFAQALRLNEEPSPDLPAWEREERRRTFWSMYLLDRLISLGPDRPLSFADSDCTVRLPSPDTAFFDGVEPPDLPTLESVITDPQGTSYSQLDYFALTAVMACTLGHFARYSLKRSLVEQFAPWDHRSSYYRIYSMLLRHESNSLLTYANLGEVIQAQLTIGTFVDHQRAGHMLFSQALFHVNHCLLNHPFILYNLFQHSPALVPLSFAREALDRSHSHAWQLLELLQEAQSFGRLAESSFFGYCAMLSGVIFRLYEHHHDEYTVTISEERVKMVLQYLERRPIRWSFHPRMAAILKDWVPTRDLAKALIDPVLLAQKTKIDQVDEMWSLLDYSALQGRVGRTTSASTASPPKIDQSNTQSSSDGVRPNTGSSGPMPSTFHVDFGQHTDDVQAYLGDEMGSIWAQVFNDQSATGSV